MLNKKLFLNEKIFEENCEKKAIRDGFGEGILELGEKNKNVVVLTADVAESTRVEEFSQKYPQRFIEVGVAEQNMAGIAAGLGVSGKIPFMTSYAVFSPGRNYEQIRTAIAYNNSNVKIVGHHGGISVGPDGATHQATEDIAIMRVMPNMKVFVPCDALEAKKATIASAYINGPIYLRLAREKSALITTEKTPFSPGKAEIFWESRNPEAAIIACGMLVRNALIAAYELSLEKINVLVLNNHTIKPLDKKTILNVAKRTKALVVVEEHQIYGGLGGAISEFLAENFPVPIEFIGMRDTFGESGPPELLIKKYGMSPEDIKKAVKKVIKRKNNI